LYPGFAQFETVTVHVANPNGVPVTKGAVAIQVDGQTVYATVVNGQATATVVSGLLDFSLLFDLFFPHPLSASYSDGTGTFLSSNTSTTVPPILLDFFLFEIAQELAPLSQFQNG
jgi:hypothetical protein